MNYLLFIINIISHKKFAISNTICLAVYLISNIFYMSHQNNSDIYSFQTLQINFAILRIHQLSNHLILNITTQELTPQLTQSTGFVTCTTCCVCLMCDLCVSYGHKNRAIQTELPSLNSPKSLAFKPFI